MSTIPHFAFSKISIYNNSMPLLSELNYKVVQVYPMENYDVAVYFVDGNIKKYNVSHLVGKGVFSVLEVVTII